MNNYLSRHRLGDLIEVSRGQSVCSDNFSDNGEYIRLTLANFDYTNGGFKEDTQKDDLFYSGKIKEDKLLEKGDIITPLTEQTPGLLGSTARIPVSDKYIHTSDIALVSCKNNIDPSYCYYLLPSNQVKKQLSSTAQQTKIRHTTPDAIKRCLVDIPNLDDQMKIGKFLDSLNKKIELNRNTCATLEKIAKQLYDYWFVQFDFPDKNGKPYKSSGGKMVYNEKLKREIPEGWSDGSIGDFIDLFDSLRKPLSNKERANIKKNPIYPYYGATGIIDYIDEYIFNGEYILLAEDGSTSDTNGNPIVQYIWGKNWVNNHAHIILPKDSISKVYTYFMLKSIPVKMIESGSIQKKVNQQNLLGYNIALPSKDMRKKFAANTDAIWKKKMIIDDEILKLTTLRDFLLPMLMNGQIK